MIARIWHGTTAAENSDDYLAFLQQRALPDYRSTPGNVAAFILRRPDGGIAHFTMITHWASLASIEAFAGAHIERAKYYPEDAGFLLEFEPTVQHCELYS